MELTRREMLRGLATGGALVLIPRPLQALPWATPAKGQTFDGARFVGAAVLAGMQVAVGLSDQPGDEIRWYSLGSWTPTRPPLRIPPPYRLGALAAVGRSLVVGGYHVLEGPERVFPNGDYFAVRPKDLEGEVGVANFPRGGTTTVRDVQIRPWISDVRPGSRRLPATRHLGDEMRGVVTGIHPWRGTHLAWISLCRSGPSFEGVGLTAVDLGVRGGRPEFTIPAGHLDGATCLTTSYGTTLIVLNDVAGVAIWELEGRSLRSLRVPGAFRTHSAAAVAERAGDLEMLLQDRQTGNGQLWVRSSGSWRASGRASTGHVSVAPGVAVTVAY